MPRAAGVSVENQFIKGLITEATGLNFPENACTDTKNCVFDEKGIVSRRLGFSIEADNIVQSYTRDDSVLNYFVWESVAGQRDVTFFVAQVGAALHYYLVSATGSLSAGLHVHGTSLLTFKIASSPATGPEDCSFDSINGVLVVTHPYCTPFYVQYDPVLDAFTETGIDVEIRDFEGVEDTLDIEEHPASLSDLHEYNLYNQGWYQDVLTEVSGPVIENPVDNWFGSFSDYPSNADVWWLYKNANEEFEPGDLRSSVATGNTAAPKGHFILDPFLTTRSSAHADIGTVTETTSSYFRPKFVAAFSSRIFYAGVNYLGYNNKIYFSQILDDLKKIGRCYQQNDPVSENLFDLLPTDGGVIVIPEIGNIITMVSLETNLLVFASNGIWSITGSQGLAFAANDYSVSKISITPASGKSSFVNIDGYPAWWNPDGIFAIGPDSQGRLVVQSLSDGTIKTFYNDIPDIEKAYAKASYNPLTKVVQWLYRSTATNDLDEHFNYDSVLNFNVLTKAFYPWSFEESDNLINGVASLKGLGAGGETFSSLFFYVTSVNTTGNAFDFTFAKTEDTGYLDFETEDYTSFAVTGYKIRGEAQRKFQMNYVTVYINQDEDASCFLQGLWNFSSSADSNHWTNAQQVYIDQPYHSVTKRRIKIRGTGVALQLKFSSETGKPFSLIGWSAFESGNSAP